MKLPQAPRISMLPTRMVHPAMNENVEIGAGAVSPVPLHPREELSQALHEKELGDLRQLVTQLLIQIESLQQQQQSTRTLVQLREANENLMFATFSAQDKQASAEASMQRQTNFLSMLAHELRNPLQPITHANTLLSKLVGDNPELPRLQAIINRQMRHMTRLIDDLLDASRISSGKIGLNKSILQLSEIVALAVEASQPGINRRHQRLEIHIPATPTFLHGDRVRLVQAFCNLLNNASKFSQESEAIELVGQVTGNMLEVSVRDHGMGISPDLQPFIFDLFTQGPQSLDRVQGGLGIGLALVRSLVELHGGTVGVFSGGAGLGSTFTIQLPLSQVQEEVATPLLPALPSHRSLRILLVEDNLDAAEMLVALLDHTGHTVTQCHDGTKAIELALAFAYDLVICDIGLPGVDGFTVVERILASLPGKPPFFIATSGYSQPQDKARAIRSGFDRYLVKPVPVETLLELIESYVH